MDCLPPRPVISITCDEVFPLVMSSLARMSDLKLIAFDQVDLAVLSAHLQDAVLRVGDMTFLPKEQRFAAVLNRFDWNQLIAAGDDNAKPQDMRRRRTGLRFERVRAAKVQGIDLKDSRATLALLAISFAVQPSPETDNASDVPEDERDGGPEGNVTLTFSGGGAIRLTVECIEAELKDLGAVWSTRRAPRHPDTNKS